LAPITNLAIMGGVREQTPQVRQRCWLFWVGPPLSVGVAMTTRNRTALAKATSVSVRLPSFFKTLDQISGGERGDFREFAAPRQFQANDPMSVRCVLPLQSSLIGRYGRR
jgi:hypothetical protein